MIKVLLKHLARLCMPVYQFESETTRIVYAGYSSIKKNYYARLFLGCSYDTLFLGWRWFWRIPDLIRSRNLDISVSEISRISFNHFQKRHGYILPEWALMRINIDRPMSEICQRRVSDFSDITRKIRKYNLSYDILTDKESFNYFNNKIYLPYITKRHGNEALIEDLNKIWNSSLSPFLIAIKEDGIIAGASLIRKSGDIFYLMRLGLVEGNKDYRRHGVIGALYYFGILEARKMGCRIFDVGGSHPFLTDRLTEYKMGLGAEFVSDYSSWKEYLWLGINEHSSFAKEFIHCNPFVYLNKDKKMVRHEA
jgi:hypothetical protein